MSLYINLTEQVLSFDGHDWAVLSLLCPVHTLFFYTIRMTKFSLISAIFPNVDQANARHAECKEKGRPCIP